VIITKIMIIIIVLIHTIIKAIIFVDLITLRTVLLSRVILLLSRVSARKSILPMKINKTAI